MSRALTRLLYPLLLLGGVAALGAAWYAGGSSGAAPDARYVEGVAGRPRPVNPLLAPDESAAADLVALLFNGLMRVDGDGTPRPDLAERWEATPDGLTYTFVLRPGLAWHDGAPVTAQDVVFTVEMLQAEAFPGPLDRATRWHDVRVFAVDERTVVMHLPAAIPDFLVTAAQPLLPRHLLADVPAEALPQAAFNAAPVGTGPFRLDTLDEAHALLERNTSYHLGTPALRTFEVRFYRDAAQLLAALESGEVSAALLGERATDREAEVLEARPALTSTDLTRSAYTLLYLNNQVAPLDDPALRRAIEASLDIETLAGVLGDGALPAQGIFVPGSWAATDAPGRRTGEDIEALWAEAGWARSEPGGERTRDGQPLTLRLVTNADGDREALAEAVAEQLRAQGVTVEVEPLPAIRLLGEHLQPRTYQLAIFGWESGPDPDPYPGWHSSQISATGRNMAAFHDPEVDRWLEQARSTLDVGERQELYGRLEQRIAEQAAATVIAYPTRPYVHPVALAGFEAGLLFNASDRFRDVHRWRLAAP
ncbi:MAG: hypothetical protein GEU80_05970 [Dehalococcoidia bacterium]|nr:hypothetical protein [Dehalococcoidia bacterium]